MGILQISINQQKQARKDVTETGMLDEFLNKIGKNPSEV